MSATMTLRLVFAMAFAAGDAGAVENPGTSASELRFCQTYPDAIAPPGAQVRDTEAFCRCYAEAAEKAGLPALERAEENVGQDVPESDANRTRSIHARKSQEAARGCLTR